MIVAIVPETGASVYSASAVAREELPELDVSLRGAVSIARRLQDPLAELVKIEPRSLGVGQYQHDVDQKSLERELDTAVEGAVNRVGVELNTASASLLRRVSGLSERLARADRRLPRQQRAPSARARRSSRSTGFGPKTFELAAGFLRVRDGGQPARPHGRAPRALRGGGEDGARAGRCRSSDLVGNPEARVHVSTSPASPTRPAASGASPWRTSAHELVRPGRDPRPEFKTPEWRPDVTRGQATSRPGMVLEGRVSNVTNFGAFVDIGVHRDGLVHVSELTHRWVADPREAVTVGQVVKVKVQSVDHERERISLSIKALQEPPAAPAPREATAKPRREEHPARGAKPAAPKPAPRPAPPPSRPESRPPAPPRQPATLADLLAKFGGTKQQAGDLQKDKTGR